jgi:antitoxin component of RelBE/YafQ-DinJ toxin-antitoxin module
MKKRITLNLDETVIAKAKTFASENNMSLSQLTELLLMKVISGNYKSLQQFPVADWVKKISTGKVYYASRSRKQVKEEYFESRK